MVAPIILYGAEVWGLYNIKEVDKLHLRFCKTLLGVKRSTPYVAVYGELGRFPFSLLAKQRALKFWIKIIKNLLSPQYQLYNEQCNMNNTKFLAIRVHSIIDHLGFRDVRIQFNENMSYFNLFKARLSDQFVQEWQASINSMSKLNYYVKYKKTFEFEPYLNIISNYMIRKCLTRFRLDSHRLEIELGRNSGTDRESHLCKLCNTNGETEYRVLMCCPKYSTIRIKYLHTS